MFASSLSSAARQPKGRGYSRKQRDIENRLGYRGRPASPKKFRRISQRTQRFLPPSLSPSLASKARECLQSPVVSIRRRLPPTGHVRFTSRAGKCIGMLAFFFFPSSSSSFSSSSPRSIPLEEIVGRGETRRANRIPDAGNGGNVGYVGRETKLIDAVKREERERGGTYIVLVPIPEMAVGKISGRYLEPGQMPIKYRYGCVSVGERIERVNNECEDGCTNSVAVNVYTVLEVAVRSCWSACFFFRFGFFLSSSSLLSLLPLEELASKFVVQCLGNY